MEVDYKLSLCNLDVFFFEGYFFFFIYVVKIFTIRSIFLSEVLWIVIKF